MSDDRFAIQDVMLRYAAGVDERDMDMYQACFAEDVEVVGFSEENIVGDVAWRQHVEGALARFGATQHMLGPVLADIVGDKAACRTDVQAFHCMVEPADATLILWATYLSEMHKIDGVWKITRHELVRRHTKMEGF